MGSDWDVLAAYLRGCATFIRLLGGPEMLVYMGSRECVVLEAYRHTLLLRMFRLYFVSTPISAKKHLQNKTKRNDDPFYGMCRKWAEQLNNTHMEHIGPDSRKVWQGGISW